MGLKAFAFKGARQVPEASYFHQEIHFPWDCMSSFDQLYDSDDEVLSVNYAELWFQGVGRDVSTRTQSNAGIELLNFFRAVVAGFWAGARMWLHQCCTVIPIALAGLVLHVFIIVVSHLRSPSCYSSPAIRKLWIGCAINLGGFIVVTSLRALPNEYGYRRLQE